MCDRVGMFSVISVFDLDCMARQLVNQKGTTFGNRTNSLSVEMRTIIQDQLSRCDDDL
jgi:hypothetical protein